MIAARVCPCGAAVAGAQFTRCVDCLMGTRKLNKLRAQLVAVESLPGMVIPAESWGFRVPGRAIAWNNALVRPQHGRPFLSPAAREWKTAVATYALKARPRNWSLDGTFTMNLHSVFASPLADRDGPLKLVQDALEGVAWRNDRQVVGGTTTKALDALAPRIEVVIWKVQS
jgi:Holliday junction resolvase RusA-like endonuclease